jgi:endonuclease/exonuclease/phosphatase family metal-dependent hydrolase
MIDYVLVSMVLTNKDTDIGVRAESSSHHMPLLVTLWAVDTEGK